MPYMTKTQFNSYYKSIHFYVKANNIVKEFNIPNSNFHNMSSTQNGGYVLGDFNYIHELIRNGTNFEIYNDYGDRLVVEITSVSRQVPILITNRNYYRFSYIYDFTSSYYYNNVLISTATSYDYNRYLEYEQGATGETNDIIGSFIFYSLTGTQYTQIFCRGVNNRYINDNNPGEVSSGGIYISVPTGDPDTFRPEITNARTWENIAYASITFSKNPIIISYTITVTESDFGTCTVDKEEAKEGETVRVVTTPNLGQKLYRLYVVGDSVGTVSVQTESDNVHTFVMPADNVKVSAIFMSNDAYVPAGTDEEDLGGGDYDDTSDPVPVPPVPSISASNIGMVTLFRPSLQNILDLGQYLYTDWWELGDNLKKWLSNPIEAMIGFNIVPCVPSVQTERVVKLGIVSTGVSMPPVVSQWYDFDCGTVDIVPYTGTMLDYAPNTKIQIMLPFIGSSALDTDEVMNRTLGLKYRIDLLSGACVAMLTINGDVRYQWTGECAVNIPFSASDFSRVYGAVLGAVGAGVTGFMAAGAAGVASQAAASAATTQAMNNNLAASKAFKEALGDVVKGSRGAPALREKLKTASQQTMDKAIAEAGNGTRIAGAIKATQIAKAVNNVVGNVMSAKGGVSHSGTISGAAGMLGVRTPYVIIEYPNQSLPVDYRHFVGYPSNITATLGELTGYTECEQLIAEGITGTDGEYTELVEALKGGVYL